jgi:hypothetical protein
MATKKPEDKPLIDPNDPMVVVSNNGYASLMLPMSKAKELVTLMMFAEKVEWDYTPKTWKPSGYDNNCEIKQVSLAQYVAYQMAKAEKIS